MTLLPGVGHRGRFCGSLYETWCIITFSIVRIVWLLLLIGRLGPIALACLWLLWLLWRMLKLNVWTVAHQVCVVSTTFPRWSHGMSEVLGASLSSDGVWLRSRQVIDATQPILREILRSLTVSIIVLPTIEPSLLRLLPTFLLNSLGDFLLSILIAKFPHFVRVDRHLRFSRSVCLWWPALGVDDFTHCATTTRCITVRVFWCSEGCTAASSRSQHSFCNCFT